MKQLIRAHFNDAKRMNGSIVSVATAIALGVLANGVYSLLLWGVAHFLRLTIITLLPWGAVTSFVIFLSTGGLFYFWRASRRSASKCSEITKILELDERIYERLVPSNNSPLQKGELKQLAVDLIQQVVDEMCGGEILRSFILLPDSQNNYLIPWVHYKMPSGGLDEIRFYIGSEPHHQHGIAGTAFMKQSIEVAHLKLQKHQLACDHEQFVTFDEKRTPRYRTIICVPILSAIAKGVVECTGVVCFDSSIMEIFDGQEAQQILKSVVKRIAEIIRIWRNIGSLPGDDLPPAV